MAKFVPSARISSEYYVVGKQPVTLQETDIEKDPEEILNQAKKKAEFVIQGAVKNADQKRQEAELYCRNLIEEAKKEGEIMKQKAFHEGYDAGKNEGLGELKKQEELLVKELKGLLEQALLEHKRLLKEIEPQVVRLSLKIAEKVIHREVSLSKDIAIEQVSAAMSKLTDHTKVVIRANLSDNELLNSSKSRLMGLHDDIKELVIIDDDRIKEGGCIIETPSGTVDARLDKQLSVIEKSFSEILEQP